MRTHTKLTMAGIIVAVLLLFIGLSAQEHHLNLRASLGEEQYEKCGLNKLSVDEETELMRIIGHGMGRSYTRESARSYLEKQGWREVRVLGAVESGNLMNELYVVVWDNYEIHTLDPWGSAPLPDPGIYWARNNLSSWKILFPDATEVSFNSREIE